MSGPTGWGVVFVILDELAKTHNTVGGNPTPDNLYTLEFLR